MLPAQQMREQTCSHPPVRRSADARPPRSASSSCGRLHPGQESAADQDRRRRSGSQQCAKSAVLLRHDPGADPTPSTQFIDYSPGPDSVSRVMRMRAVPRNQPREEPHWDALPARPPDCPEAAHESRSRSGRHRCESVEPEGIFKGTLIPRCAVGGNQDADSKPRVLIPPDAHRCHKAVAPRCGPPKSRKEPDPQFPMEVKQRSKRGKTARLHSTSKGKAKFSSPRSFPSFKEMSSEKGKKKHRVSFATEAGATRNVVNNRYEKGREAGAAVTGESETQIADTEGKEFQMQSTTVAEKVCKDRDRGRTASDQPAVTDRTQRTQVNHWEDRQNLNQAESSQVNESSPPEQQEVDKDADNSSELESQSGVAYMETDQQETEKGEEADQQQGREQAAPQSTDECQSYVIEVEQQNSTGSSEQQQSDESVGKERQPRVSDPSAGTPRECPNTTVLIYKTEIETYIEDDDEEEEADVQEQQATYEPSEQPPRDQTTLGGTSGTAEHRSSREHTLREQSHVQPKGESYWSAGVEQRMSGVQTISAGIHTESARKSYQGEQRRSDVYRQQEALRQSEKTEDAGWSKADSGAEQEQIARRSSGQQPLQVADDPTKNWPESSVGSFGPEQQAPGCQQPEIPDTCQEALRQDAERRRRRELADRARAAVLCNMLVKRPETPEASDAKGKASKVEEAKLEEAPRGCAVTANIYAASLPNQPGPVQQRGKPTAPLPKCFERAMDIKWVREGQSVVKLANGVPSGIRVISRCGVKGDIYGSCEQSPTEPVAVESGETDVDQLDSDKDPFDKDAEENGQGTTEDTGDPVMRHKKKCCGC